MEEKICYDGSNVIPVPVWNSYADIRQTNDAAVDRYLASIGATSEYDIYIHAAAKAAIKGEKPDFVDADEARAAAVEAYLWQHYTGKEVSEYCTLRAACRAREVAAVLSAANAGAVEYVAAAIRFQRDRIQCDALANGASYEDTVYHALGFTYIHSNVIHEAMTRAASPPEQECLSVLAFAERLNRGGDLDDRINDEEV